MSNVNTDKPSGPIEIENQPASTGGPVYETYEKVDYNRTGALDAEKIEHDMTVLEAVKAYPAASFWAFVMSCTIVSYLSLVGVDLSNAGQDHGIVLCLPHGSIYRNCKILPGLWSLE